jgi:hypothetical protein
MEDSNYCFCYNPIGFTASIPMELDAATRPCDSGYAHGRLNILFNQIKLLIDFHQYQQTFLTRLLVYYYSQISTKAIRINKANLD